MLKADINQIINELTAELKTEIEADNTFEMELFNFRTIANAMKISAVDVCKILFLGFFTKEIGNPTLRKEPVSVESQILSMVRYMVMLYILISEERAKKADGFKLHKFPVVDKNNENNS